MQRQMGTMDERSPWLLCHTCQAATWVSCPTLGGQGDWHHQQHRAPTSSTNAYPPHSVSSASGKTLATTFHMAHIALPLCSEIRAGTQSPSASVPIHTQLLDPVQVPNLPLGLLCSLMKGSQPAQRK